MRAKPLLPESLLEEILHRRPIKIEQIDASWRAQVTHT
jgi:hypothetical protein